MDNVTLRWLHSLNLPHEQLGLEVFSGEVEGEPSVGVTNGHALLLVAHRHLTPPDDKEKVEAEQAELAKLKPFPPAEAAVQMLAASKRWSVDLDALKLWASRPPAEAAILDCDLCMGTGFTVADDIGPVFDSEGCGPHDGPFFEPCPACEHALMRPGRVFGVVVNRYLLRRYLGALEGPATVATLGAQQLAVCGPGWLLILMGLRSDLDNGPMIADFATPKPTPEPSRRIARAAPPAGGGESLLVGPPPPGPLGIHLPTKRGVR